MCRWLVPFSLTFALLGCALTPRPSVEQEDAYFTPARLERLGTADRAAWQRYLTDSRAARDRDRRVLEQEARAAGHVTWIPAGDGPVFELSPKMDGEWWSGQEARLLADAIVSYQTPSGGWSKRVDLTKPRGPGQSWAPGEGWHYVGTFDNLATVEHLTYLARIHARQPRAAYTSAFARGIAYVLSAQFPNGCFPQVYPLEGGYHDAVTFNDDALVRVLTFLSSVIKDSQQIVPGPLRERAGAAVEKGVRCILDSQVTEGGKKTVWGAQHDPLTLQPVRARAYEHESLSGRESAAVLDFLLAIEPASPELVAAVHAAARWFRAHAIQGFTYEPRGQLVAKEGAGPLWARFYELGTNRPLFSDRDGVRRYDLREIGEERRTGYLWYTDEPRSTLRRYDAWARRHPATTDGSQTP